MSYPAMAKLAPGLSATSFLFCSSPRRSRRWRTSPRQMSNRHAEQCGRQGLLVAPAPHRLQQRGEDDPEAEVNPIRPTSGIRRTPSLEWRAQEQCEREQPPQGLGRHGEPVAPPGRMHADGQNTMSGSIGTRNINAKTGGPTESFLFPEAHTPAATRCPRAPVRRRRRELHCSPARKIPASTARSRRHIQLRRPPGIQVREPPMVTTRNASMYRPRVGSVARNAPRPGRRSAPGRFHRLRENANIASSRVQLLKMPRFSVTLRE